MVAKVKRPGAKAVYKAAQLGATFQMPGYLAHPSYCHALDEGVSTQ